MYIPAKATADGWTTAKKNKRFAEIYVIECGYNASAAYRRLWHEINPDKTDDEMPCQNTIRKKGYEYRHKPAVQKQIEKIEQKIEESQTIRRNETIFNLREIAFNEDNPNSDRLKAIDLLNKMGGFYTENYKVDANATIEVTLED